MKNKKFELSDTVKNKIPEMVIAPDIPFARDALDRKDLARRLTQLVEFSITPYTLALDANWGEGKTTFLKMWQADLQKSGFQCVYYDAWASDFCYDSFPSMVAGLKESFPAPENETAADKIAELRKKAPLSPRRWRKICPALWLALSAAEKLCKRASISFSANGNLSPPIPNIRMR